MPRPIDPRRAAALSAWLADHHAVIDVPTLRRLGFDRRYGDRQLAARRWQRVYAGVYVAYTGPLTPESRVQAAVLAAGEHAAADLNSAAWLWKVPGHDPTPLRVAVPHGSVRTTAAIGVRQSRNLTERSFSERSGIRVLRLEHALVAIAVRSPKRARTVLTAAVQQGHTTVDRLGGALLLMGRVRNRKLVVLILDDIAGGSRSWLEAAVVRLVVGAGLPRPVQNFALRIEGRRVWLDLCWPDLRICIEVDGKAYHLLAEDWEDDLERQNDIVLDGWLILRISARALRESPELVLQRIARAIATRRQELGLGPAVDDAPEWSGSAAS